MVILHLNNYQGKPIYSQVILPHMQELESYGIENIYFDGNQLKNNGLDGRFIYICLSIKIFIEKVLKNLLTKFDYNFYNVLERVSIVSSNLILKKIKKKPDVIVLYWISGSFNMKTIYKLQKKTGAKIYWYFMDKAPMTGGCHYTWDCKGYETTGCKNCCAFKYKPISFLASKNFSFKEKYFNKLDLTAISPTVEMFKLIGKSMLFKNKENLLQPIGINEKFFKYFPTNYLDFANLSQDAEKVYLLTGANNVNDRRKGLHLFVKALQILKQTEPEILKKIVILIIGHSKVNSFGAIGVNAIELGYVNPSQLVKLYNFIDVFVCPSIEDAGPLMVNQSIICGTPVIAFDTGVAPDLINSIDEGYIAKLGDINDFATGLVTLLKRNSREDNIPLRAMNRKKAIKKIGISISSANFADYIQNNK